VIYKIYYNISRKCPKNLLSEVDEKHNYKNIITTLFLIRAQFITNSFRNALAYKIKVEMT
jgi:hypothetical protein